MPSVSQSRVIHSSRIEKKRGREETKGQLLTWPRASCVKQNTVWLLVNLSPGTSSLPAKVLGILGFVEVESSYMNAVPDLLKGCSSLAIGESMPNSSDSLSGSERRTCHERDRGFGLAHARVPAFPPQPRASTMRCCLCMTRGHNLL